MLVPEISRADLSPHARIVTVPAADLRELHLAFEAALYPSMRQESIIMLPPLRKALTRQGCTPWVLARQANRRPSFIRLMPYLPLFSKPQPMAIVGPATALRPGPLFSTK